MPSNPGPIDTPLAWAKLLAGLFCVFALFQLAGSLLGSDRGESGLLIGAGVVAALLGVEYALFGQPPARALRSLGLGLPAGRAMLAAAVVSGALLLVIPAYLHLLGTELAMAPGWLAMLPGLFAQAGIAEETLFRGYLFRRLRRGRSFGRAVLLAMAPFIAVHLLLFVSLPWPVALASLILAAIVSVPLAYLFELGGTIWAPALLHFTVQGAMKVVAIPPEAATSLPLVWIAASALVPLSVLLVARRRVPPP